jgi:hypothetical protein
MERQVPVRVLHQLLHLHLRLLNLLYTFLLLYDI